MDITSTRPLRFLVCDAYPANGRVGLQQAGATLAGRLYERLLLRLEPTAAVTVICPADSDSALPAGDALTGYDGVVWTGSSLTIYQGDDPRVRRQVELARAVYDAATAEICAAQQLPKLGMPAGGSCAP